MTSVRINSIAAEIGQLFYPWDNDMHGMMTNNIVERLQTNLREISGLREIILFSIEILNN